MKKMTTDQQRKGLNRRQLFNAALVAGAGTIPLLMVPGLLRGQEPLRDFTWAGYEVPDLHGDYISKHGGSPEISFFGSEDEALAKLRISGGIDIAHPCSSTIMQWHEAGVLKPVDVSRLKNWPTVLDSLKGIPGTKAGGDVLWVPFDWGSNSIVYRTDLVDPEYMKENSWKVLWDERYKGRTGMWDSVDGAVAMAAAVLGIKDTSNVTGDEFSAIENLLREQQKNLLYYWSSETDAEASLASGEFAATYLWSGSYYRLKEQGVPVDYMLSPKEGIVSFACGLVLLDDGKGDDEAVYDFIDAMLSPESGKFMIEQYGYGHSNAKSYDIVDKEVLEQNGISGTVEEYIGKTSFFQYWPTDLRTRYVNMWESVKLG